MVVTLVAIGCVAQLLVAALVALSIEYSGTPSQSARGTGHDAEWLGHAWVDGRKSQSDVDVIAAHLRTTGIRDLFVHAGPFRDDGTLDPALRPRARWLTQALHTALPGVRVQAWLGAHPVAGQLQLGSASTSARVLSAVGDVLDDGFDGIHYDFEPVSEGNEDLLAMLRATRVVTQRRHRLLSISAIHGEPWPGIATCLALLPANLSLWSRAYLHQVALLVDQVAVMAYDTGLPTEATYGGYVRRATEIALGAVPPDVALLIGVPAYHDETFYHHRRAETVAAALRGVRLALGSDPPRRDFGVAMYVDFAATTEDWSSYHHDWEQVSG